MLQKECEGFVIKLLTEQGSEEVIWRNIIFVLKLLGDFAAELKWA